MRRKNGEREASFGVGFRHDVLLVEEAEMTSGRVRGGRKNLTGFLLTIGVVLAAYSGCKEDEATSEPDSAAQSVGGTTTSTASQTTGGLGTLTGSGGATGTGGPSTTTGDSQGGGAGHHPSKARDKEVARTSG